MSPIEIFATAQVLDSGVQIPSPPALLNELNALLDEADVNIGKVAALITRDAGATAMLFKLAGSPMFGGRKAPDTIEGVINLLGLSVVADLVRGMLLRNALSGPPPFYTWFWERSDNIADLAGNIAARLKSLRIAPSHARLAALFMDCGVAVLADRHTQYIQALQTPSGYGYIASRVSEMDDAIKTDHATVGGLIAKHWKLPEYVCDAIRMHHDPEITSPRVTVLVAILLLAAHLYRQKGYNEDPGWDEARDRVMDTLHLGDHDLEELLETL